MKNEDGSFGEAVTKDTVFTGDQVTLIAKWRDYQYIIKYNVKYSDKSTTTGSMADQTAPFGQDVTLTRCGFSREGYEFAGWAESSYGTEVKYLDGAVINRPFEEGDYWDDGSEDGETYNLYAIWTENKSPEQKEAEEKLAAAEEAEVHGFEDKNVFEGCMPVEVMARRGEDTLRYGPLKPVGLRDPATDREPYAVVQLRRDNAAGNIYNLVGFQTHLRFPEQKRVFSMIPALHDAEFVRYGVMHRNTFLNSPKLLDACYADRRDPMVAFAGQMTGVEGYVESCASGYLAAVSMAARLEGRPVPDFGTVTAIGALAHYVSDGTVASFQPMNVNFGIIAPLEQRVRGKANKNLAIANRSLAHLEAMEK